MQLNKLQSQSSHRHALTFRECAIQKYTWLPMSQIARHLLFWSHTRLKSMHAIHIPVEIKVREDAYCTTLLQPHLGTELTLFAVAPLW